MKKILGKILTGEKDADDLSQEVVTRVNSLACRLISEMYEKLYETIRESVWHMEAYMFGLETMDEAYENACADLEEHMEYIMAGDSPMLFYDGGYDNFLLRGEDLRINKN